RASTLFRLWPGQGTHLPHGEYRAQTRNGGHMDGTVVLRRRLLETATLHWAPRAPPESSPCGQGSLDPFLKHPLIEHETGTCRAHTHGSRKTVRNGYRLGAPGGRIHDEPTRVRIRPSSALPGNQETAYPKHAAPLPHPEDACLVRNRSIGSHGCGNRGDRELRGTAGETRAACGFRRSDKFESRIRR